METIFFDLDGTLIDHFEAIRTGVNHAARSLDLPERSLEEIHAAVGGAIRLSLGRLLGESVVEAALPYFHEAFEAVYLDQVRVIPGAAWLLGALRQRKITLAVLTNKDQRYVDPLLERVGLAGYLDGIFGTHDDGLRKPQRAFTERAMRALKADPANTMLIGDSPFDAETAKAAGIPVYLVATGSHSLAELKAAADAAGYFTDPFALGQTVFELPCPDATSC
jgi:HAD superfamily hydrolase (TIGR01509 family)